MSDERMDPQEAIEMDGAEVEDIPETAGPVEDVTPGTGAIGRPDLGANPFA